MTRFKRFSQKTLIGLLFLVCTHTAAFAQLEDLRIFGYAQTLFYTQQDRVKADLRSINPNLPVIEQTNNSSTFSLQQLNVMFSKPFADRFNVFLNLEYTLSYASGRGWGTFSVEEAWATYDHADWLTVKVGLLLPTFNNLNDIKNRTALLPYLFRPVVYETNLASILNFEDFLPERAYLQVNGFVPIADNVRFDYALHAGNAETSYIANNTDRMGTSGEDTSPFKSFGGRIGIRNSAETFKAGFSATYDRDNRRDSTSSPIGLGNTSPVIPALGDVPRVRLGGDVSFTLGNFAFEGEFIGVRHDVRYPNSEMTLDKNFFYANALYNITDQLYVYGNYSFLTGEGPTKNDVYRLGFDQFGVGGGWRVNQSFIPKIQYSRIMSRSGGLVSLEFNYFFVGLSVIF